MPNLFECPACESQCEVSGAEVCSCCGLVLCRECFNRHQQVGGHIFRVRKERRIAHERRPINDGGDNERRGTKRDRRKRG